MGATEGRSQMCHWSKVMKRLLAPCSHPFLLVSEGLFEKQDKYSPSPWQIFFILVTIMTFIAPRNAADALQRRGMAVHRRERGLCDSSLRFFCRNCQNLWRSHWTAPVEQNSPSTGFGVSFNNSSAGSPLLLVCMFYGFALLHCTLRKGANPLRTVQHVRDPICLSNWAEWEDRAEEYDDNIIIFVSFRAFYTGFLTVNLFYMSP